MQLDKLPRFNTIQKKSRHCTKLHPISPFKTTVMRRYFLLVLSLSFVTSAFAQNAFKKNDMYFEFLGNGIGASVNYERQLGNKPGLGLRLGVGYFSGDEQFRLSIPIGVNYLFAIGKNNSFLDAGVGGTWSGAAGLNTKEPAGARDYSERVWSFIPSVGYRRHTKSNLMWRTSFTPVINKYRVMPWLGVSIGKRF